MAWPVFVTARVVFVMAWVVFVMARVVFVMARPVFVMAWVVFVMARLDRAIRSNAMASKDGTPRPRRGGDASMAVSARPEDLPKHVPRQHNCIGVAAVRAGFHRLARSKRNRGSEHGA
jgi:hypothetical protein